MITHRIYPSLGIVVSTWRGQVSDADLVLEYRRLYEDDEWKPGAHELVDVREADLVNVSSRGLKTLAGVMGEYLVGFEGEFKTAVLTSGDLTFGLGRVYEAYSAESPETVQVFRDPREALAWLAAPADLLD